MRLGWLLSSVLAFGCCTLGPAEKLEPSGTGKANAFFCDTCRRYSSPVSAGTVENSELTEISGIVASTADDVYFVHNDSGDSARFWAISSAGLTLGEFRLPGVEAIDMEDMAMGPCPSGQCVFLGDVGDNRYVRNNYSVYRIPEPSQFSGVTDVSFEKFEFSYPGNAHHNVEAMVVDPDSGIPYLLTKVGPGEVAQVFRFPERPSVEKKVELVKVADLEEFSKKSAYITAADFHSCGKRLVIRTYTGLFSLRGEPDASFESLFLLSPVEMPVAAEFQGESVAFQKDGLGYVTVSEGSGPPIHLARCR